MDEDSRCCPILLLVFFLLLEILNLDKNNPYCDSIFIGPISVVSAFSPHIVIIILQYSDMSHLS